MSHEFAKHVLSHLWGNRDPFHTVFPFLQHSRTKNMEIWPPFRNKHPNNPNMWLVSEAIHFGIILFSLEGDGECRV